MILFLREVTFINESIFEPHKNPIQRGESSYIYIYMDYGQSLVK